MRILVAHNRYVQRGGEDAAFEQEAALLEAKGHDVRRWERSNADLETVGRLALARTCIWSRAEAAAMASVVRTWRPDIVHIHNFVARLSPAIHRAAVREGAAVVQTLHNFRLLCPNGLLFRDGCPCTLCQRLCVKWPAVRYGCYREARSASLALACMLAIHRAMRTWSRVHAFVALTDAARKEFIRGGLPERRLHVKPNFAPDPGMGTGGAARGGLVYAGRLSEEKGIAALLDAWSRVRTDERLTVIGDGPLLCQVRERAMSDTRITVTGWVERSEVSKRLAGCRAVVIPSLCREMFPMAVLEAFASGTPVIASRTPTLGELVVEGETGFLADPGDADAFAAAMARMLADPGQTSRMGSAARATYETRYTPDSNYRQLIGIYEAAVAERDCHSTRGWPR